MANQNRLCLPALKAFFDKDKARERVADLRMWRKPISSHRQNSDWATLWEKTDSSEWREGPLDAGSSLPLSLIYLFLAVLGLLCCTWAFSSWGEWGLPSGSGAQASDCSGFSCGANALGLQGSAAVAHTFGCPEACGIFPDQGSTPRPLHWKADS